MTEAEWLACGNPERMLKLLGKKLSERKLRLFSCACCRRVWGQLTVEGCHLVEVAERYADQEATRKALGVARVAAARETADDDDIIDGLAEYQPRQANLAALNAAGKRENMMYTAECAADASEDGDRERVAQCSLLRDIFGNPFRPVAVDPSWLTSTVVALARGIYEERAFDRTPILADALQDAGCDNADVLDHLRGGSPHVRGCWVVDLLLGKA